MAVTAHERVALQPLLSLLDEARLRTLELIAPLSDQDLATQHDVLMSPVLWDLGHIAHFEELWLTQNLDGPIRFAEMPGMYNPFEHPRRVRGQLVYPTRTEAIELMQSIRDRVLARLERVTLGDENPLLRDGYVMRMVLQHEYQHNETILQTLQLKLGEPYRAPRRYPIQAATLPIPRGAMVRFPGGSATIGTNDRSESYDNERPRFEITLPAFWIDVAPVRNGEYLEFMGDGGYDRRELWSEEGWEYSRGEGRGARGEGGTRGNSLEAPKYWYLEDGEWHTRTMDRSGPVDPEHPVCHVSFHEAEAYARWAGKRLPTELEWEVAASWDPDADAPRKYPWGFEPPSPSLANVDQLSFGTAPVGAYPRNVSPLGCYGLIGDVWEWTSSHFTGYPGFDAFPYPEYSQVFFGSEYRVLRGGSWATRPGAIRNTFRNWDYPMRRQIFSGFRCARDA
jgi:iron(II)-dependent oxidoreductase